MGILLLIPFFLIRFGLMALLDRNAITRAAHFPPLIGWETAAYWVYQSSNAAILLFLFFLKINPTTLTMFYFGIGCYSLGIILLTASVIFFAVPSEGGISEKGPYRLSRNPMYVAYFIIFFGCALLTRSIPLLCCLLVFQLAAHWIIRSEERWCVERFGEAYLQYMKRVRRYL